MPRVLYIMVGMPGSGKTHWVEQLQPSSLISGRSRRGRAVINPDGIRKELTGSQSDQTMNKRVFEVAHRRLKEGFIYNQYEEIIFDATNLTKTARTSLKNIALHCNALPLCVYMATDPAECFKRNLLRERVVPAHAMIKMLEQSKKVNPTTLLEEGFAVICPNM